MFVKRIFLYLIGFLLGSILAYFLIFKGRNQSFFPSGIVLDSLSSKEIIIEKKVECMFECNNISTDVKKYLDDAKVIFSESSPRETPKKYVVEIELEEGKTEEKKVKLTFELFETTAKIISAEIINGEKNCNCY